MIAVLLVGRSPAAARQLASRARRRVQGKPAVPAPDRPRQHAVVDAFLAALRGGDIEGLVAVLDPDVMVRIDEAAARPGAPREIRGARNRAAGAVTLSQAARFALPMLVDGGVGLVWAPGRLSRVLKFTITRGKVTEVDIVADPAPLRLLDLVPLNR
ncbi:MAG TPA: hypothetical protein VKW09_13620 [bacterium]|nr:hypothetical protein [bacterium]